MINPGQLAEPNLKEEGVKDLQNILRKAEEWQFGTHQEYIGRRQSLIIEKGIFENLIPAPPRVSARGEDESLGSSPTRIIMRGEDESLGSSPEKYREMVENVLRDKKHTEIDHLLLE